LRCDTDVVLADTLFMLGWLGTTSLCGVILPTVNVDGMHNNPLLFMACQNFVKGQYFLAVTLLVVL
jgi:hypothetical protein